jgi:hypothetical protein
MRFPSGPAVDFLVNGSCAVGTDECHQLQGRDEPHEHQHGRDDGRLLRRPARRRRSRAAAFPNVAKGHEYTVLALPGTAAADIGLIDDPFDKGLLSNSARRARLQRVGRTRPNLDLYLVQASFHRHQPTSRRRWRAWRSRTRCRRAARIRSTCRAAQYVLIATAAGSKTPVYPVAGVHAVEQRRLAGDVGADRRCAEPARGGADPSAGRAERQHAARRASSCRTR